MTNPSDEFELRPTNAPLLPELTCDVCGGKADGVCASALGAISFAYCRYCLGQNAEPAGMLYMVIRWDCGGLENCAPWVRNLSTFYEGRYWTAEEFVAVNRDDVFPDPFADMPTCPGCGGCGATRETCASCNEPCCTQSQAKAPEFE